MCAISRWRRRRALCLSRRARHDRLSPSKSSSGWNLPHCTGSTGGIWGDSGLACRGSNCFRPPQLDEGQQRQQHASAQPCAPCKVHATAPTCWQKRCGLPFFCTTCAFRWNSQICSNSGRGAEASAIAGRWHGSHASTAAQPTQHGRGSAKAPAAAQRSLLVPCQLVCPNSTPCSESGSPCRCPLPLSSHPPARGQQQGVAQGGKGRTPLGHMCARPTGRLAAGKPVRCGAAVPAPACPSWPAPPPG